MQYKSFAHLIIYIAIHKGGDKIYNLYVYIHNLNILYITQVTVTVIQKLKHQCSGPMHTCIYYSIQVNTLMCML